MKGTQEKILKMQSSRNLYYNVEIFLLQITETTLWFLHIINPTVSMQSALVTASLNTPEKIKTSLATKNLIETPFFRSVEMHRNQLFRPLKSFVNIQSFKPSILVEQCEMQCC